uniref:Transglutaminase-like domain-containing protein n=1 Tax=OCS116 cluster bacterium TaxID=2030921 RepID=A0A2A4YUW7_9PROT
MQNPLILADYQNPIVEETATRLTSGEKNVRDKLHRIFDYVRDDIVFAFPDEGDLVKASETIQKGFGQCNTKATLFLALCKAAGIPSRIHYSLISRDIQKGFFTGIAYWAMPKEISHSWIEVEVDEKWRRIDTFINDLPLFNAAIAELGERGWSVGYSVALGKNKPSGELNLDKEAFQQMAAVTSDHGVWDEPADYFSSKKYKNRPGAFKLWLYRRMIGNINNRVRAMRNKVPMKDLASKSSQRVGQ